MLIFKLFRKIKKPTLVLFVLLFGIGGALLIKISFASVPNPDGFADYCYLQGDNTVIYGWAHDDDAPAGDAPYVTVRLSTGQSVTVPTNIGGYRDAEINQYLGTKGHTTSSIYGFKAVFSGVYKGTAPAISGTIVNYGAGADTNLGINYFRTVDGNPYNFPDQKVPDGCLPSAPVPTFPNPVIANPQPTPKPPRRPQQPAPVAGLSSEANANLAIGSVVASLSIPNDNADQVAVNYGLTAENLDMNSGPIDITPDTTTVLLTKLSPDNMYYYQLARFKKDNRPTTSPTSSFKTLDLDALLIFVNGDQPAAGVQPTIDGVASNDSSDEKGQLAIKHISVGNHKISFRYNNKDYQKQIVISATGVQAEASEGPLQGLVTTKVEFQDKPDAQPAAPAKPKKGSKVGLIILSVLFLALVSGGVFWLVRRRRSAAISEDYSFLPPPPQPNNSPSPIPTVTVSTTPQSGSVPSSHSADQDLPPTALTGESLPDLVIRSIRAEAARKKSAADKKDLQQ